MTKAKFSQQSAAFTILEIATVIVVISILATMAFGSYVGIRDKARRAACVNNLKGLYVSMTGYLTDYDGIWPQVPSDDLTDPNYALTWVKLLRPYKLDSVNWICPAIQATIGGDYVHNPRLDYFPTPFGIETRVAFKYATQPWFVERADIHGDGNLVIFANGDVKSLNDIVSGSHLQTLPQ